jgi:phage portal protein BeeE
MNFKSLFSKKEAPLYTQSDFERTVNQALTQYWINTGQANVMPDNPEAYLKQGYSGNITVYSIIDRVNKMRRQAKLTLYKRKDDGSKEVVTGHDLNRFQTRANNSMFIDDFLDSFVIYMMAIGEDFVYAPKIRTGVNKGKTTEIFELPAADVEIIEGSYFEPVRGYKLTGNWEKEFEKSEVYHSRYINPNWRQERSLHGLSPLRAAARKVAMLNEADDTELKQLENQGAPYILFKRPESSQLSNPANSLGKEQRAKMAKDLKTQGNTGHRGLPYISGVALERLDLGQKLADLALNELTNSCAISLCSVYHFPAELFGLGQKTYNNMATARKAAWTDCIMPMLDRILQMLNETTINHNDYFKEGYFWAFDYSDVEELQEMFETQVNWMRKSGRTLNEIREATGAKPYKDQLMDEPVIEMGTSFLSDYNINLDEGQKDYSDYLK